MELSREQLLSEIEDLLRQMPNRETIRHEAEENFSWIGRALALIEAWKPSKMITFGLAVSKFGSTDGRTSRDGLREILTIIHQAWHDLRLSTVGPMSVSVSAGKTFEYFDEIRKMIEIASEDLFFVDPYLDADFVSRYLPHAKSGVAIRLLTSAKKKSTLLPAVEMFARQENRTVSVKDAGPGLHDRYLFIDRRNCYQSGASFKDGARQSPTTLTQITDAFDAVYSIYDEKWKYSKDLL